MEDGGGSAQQERIECQNFVDKSLVATSTKSESNLEVGLPRTVRQQPTFVFWREPVLIWRKNVKSFRMRRSATDGVTAEADLAQCDASRLPPPFLFLWLLQLVQFFFSPPLC